MKRLHLTSCLIIALALAGCARPAGQVAVHRELLLVEALPVEADHVVEPSGLAWWGGGLYAVADKEDGVIFRVEIGADAARMVPAVRFNPPAGGGWMDWEGITVDATGVFYLVSEEQGRVLRVTPDGLAAWATPDLRPHARAAGLFAKDNAGFEGIAWLGPDHFLGVVEREPRGLVEWRGEGASLEVKASVQDQSPFSSALPLLRLPDYADLATDRGTIYALFRNAHLVVRLERADGAFEETAAWSYAHIETDPRWAYRSQTYGQAEGLVVRGNDVYLIFDNNRGGRQADPQDRRPLLVHARFP